MAAAALNLLIRFLFLLGDGASRMIRIKSLDFKNLSVVQQMTPAALKLLKINKLRFIIVLFALQRTLVAPKLLTIITIIIIIFYSRY